MNRVTIQALAVALFAISGVLALAKLLGADVVPWLAVIAPAALALLVVIGAVLLVGSMFRRPLTRRDDDAP